MKPLLVCLVFVLAACGGDDAKKKPSMHGKLVKGVEQVTAVLAAIKTGEDATAAAPKVERLASKLLQMKRKIESANANLDEDARQKQEKAMEAAKTKLRAEITRLTSDPDLQGPIKANLNKLAAF